MSICRHLIEHMAGEVNVESDLDEGTTFTLTFNSICIYNSENESRKRSSSSSDSYGSQH